MLVFTFCKKRILIILLSCLAVYFSASSYHINTHWKTKESFWAQSVEYGAVAIAHQNYGLAVVRKEPEPEPANHSSLPSMRQLRSPANIAIKIYIGFTGNGYIIKFRHFILLVLLFFSF